ncbi:MAG: peptidoglycan editing factor PgeF [Alphaproteobacteria bacterium]|nr:peptidoglycan editing factor PgeF [Candidatus Jidaibacter sp.]
MLAKKIKQFTDESIEHGFITRKGGVSNGLFASMTFGKSELGDAKGSVMRNFQIVADNYNIKSSAIHHIHQIHSTDVVKILDKNQHTSAIKADAMVTKLPNIMLLIKTADCCPILFHDPMNKVIGAAHAGWRGAFGGIIDNTISKMLELGANINNIEAAIGPTIRQNTYEVDDVFYNTFINQDVHNSVFFIPSVNINKYMFDLPGYCTYKLNKAGVSKVHDIKLNTYENEDEFHSCRRAFHKGEAAFGVQGSVIMIKNQ